MRRGNFSLCFLMSFLLSWNVTALALDTLSPWILFQSEKATWSFLNNISPAGTSPGVVLASPSRVKPNYYFHWVRDASLAMDQVVTMFQSAQDQPSKTRFYNMIVNFIAFSRGNQLTPNLSDGPGDEGDGEVKFNVDGSAFSDPWGRPQNDGPALRAIALTRFAFLMLAEGKNDFVRSSLYDGHFPATSVIKADLEFVAHHWRDPSFDVWEEVKGDHFYTRMVQRKSLLDGASLAEALGNNSAAAYYRNEAAQLQIEIRFHWNSQKGYLEATRNKISGHDHKNSGLDIAVILGVLHAQTGDGFFNITNEMVLATASHLINTFKDLYPINKITHDSEGHALNVALGRYPEDKYDGVNSLYEAHAWVLATNAMAELCYRARKEWNDRRRITITDLNKNFFDLMAPGVPVTAGETIYDGDPRYSQILNKMTLSGDKFIRRVKFHSNPDGSLSEQMNRYSGYMQGARELTWSCSSFLGAINHR